MLQVGCMTHVTVDMSWPSLMMVIGDDVVVADDHDDDYDGVGEDMGGWWRGRYRSPETRLMMRGDDGYDAL